MENMIDLSAKIEEKVLLLLQKKADLTLKNNSLETKCNNYEQIIYNQKQQIAELEKKINVLKISGGFSSGKDSTKAKLAINELVREIEKCIGLLDQ